MDSDLRKVVRRRQTLDAAKGLQQGIADWLLLRRQRDRKTNGAYAGRHQTQLQSIGAVLVGPATALVADAEGVSTADAESAVYRRCYELDEAAAWLRRLWQFYREKFDQRDDPRLGPTLRAADEIIWSTFDQVMGSPAVKGARVVHGPPPLASIVHQYSPAVIPGSSPLSSDLNLQIELKTLDAELRGLISRVAIPLVMLPEWHVRAPWWLIFIAHEVGHQIYSGLSLSSHVDEGIQAAAMTYTGSREASREWRQWSEEIVADVCSLLLVGPAAVTALADVTLAVAESACASWGTYPPPVIRLALLTRLAGQLHLQAPSVSSTLSLDAWRHNDYIARHAEAIDPVLAAVTKPLPQNLGALETLTGFSIESTQTTADAWSTHLLATRRGVTNTLEAARQVVAGSFGARQSLLEKQEQTPETFEQEAGKLADHALGVLGDCGPEGVRAAAPPPPDIGKAVIDRLRALSRHQMLPSVEASA